jgi:hypothetical protein
MIHCHRWYIVTDDTLSQMQVEITDDRKVQRYERQCDPFYGHEERFQHVNRANFN